MYRFKFIALVLFAIFLSSTAFAQVTVETITEPFDASGGVTIDDTGIVYVADFGPTLGAGGGSNVYKVLPDGTVQLFATGLNGASGNEFDSLGNLFQSEITDGQVSRISPDGTVVPWAGSNIFGPVGVAIGQDGSIYVANCGTNNIARVIPVIGGTENWASSSLLTCPNGLTIDENDNLYTCNFNNGNIIKITPAKEFSVLASVPGGRCGHLTYFEGNLYVAARCAQQIYRVSLTGEMTLIAGSGGRGTDDGIGELATFNHPNGIEAIRVGDNIELYLNDAVSLEGNCTSVPLDPVVVRKITIDPADLATLPSPVNSSVVVSDSLLQANGSDSLMITVTPLNQFGNPPADGIDSITVSTTKGGKATSPAIDNMDGTFSLSLVAPTTGAFDTLSIVVAAGGVAYELNAKPTVYFWPCGDINADAKGPNISDLTYLVDYLFGIPPGPAPQILAAADVSGMNGTINISDLTFLVAYLFGGGETPACGS